MLRCGVVPATSSHTEKRTDNQQLSLRLMMSQVKHAAASPMRKGEPLKGWVSFILSGVDALFVVVVVFIVIM